jgi:GDSL-like Lipase/Acylhydrolase family
MRPGSGPLTQYSRAMGRILCPIAAALVSLACAGATLAVSPMNARADWLAAPVVPKLGGATAQKLVATRRRGSNLGNRADVFAKVGDSISASPAFLQSLGCGQWRPGRYGGLRATVRYFSATKLPGASSQCGRSNSFSRNSAATRAMTPSLWAIDPHADPSRPPCLADESPLACEIRLDRPAYAVFLFGTNDVSIALGFGSDPVPDYVANMDRIVSIARGLGVVPILTTLPPRGDSAAAEAMTERMNHGLWQVATTRHVPLINLWRALVALPNRGLATDNLHLSVSGSPGCAARCFAADFTRSGLRYGSDVRNLITLRTLARLSRLTAGPKR